MRLCRPNFGSPDRTLSRPSGLFNSSELGRQLARRLSNQLRRIMSVRSSQDQEAGDEENGGRVRDNSPRPTADDLVTVASTVSKPDWEGISGWRLLRKAPATGSCRGCGLHSSQNRGSQNSSRASRQTYGCWSHREQDRLCCQHPDEAGCRGCHCHADHERVHATFKREHTVAGAEAVRRI